MRVTARFMGVSLKMYFDHERTVAWAKDVAALAETHPAVRDGHVELVVLPSHTSLPDLGPIAGGAGIALGAQDVAEHDSGPYTGEVSAASLSQVGCRYAEVGHAERRARHGEDDAVAGRKAAAAWRHGLVPILCVGEERRVGTDAAVEHCLAQVRAAVAHAGAEASGELVVAYEPVWAIGSTHAASAERVAVVAGALRELLADHPAVTSARVIYGGSAGPGVLTELDGAVDGLFLGRFAHDPRTLSSVLDETVEHIG
ncbi:triose-phosphate isomerase family protein [Glycomyces xiaoerkulensis]|uniref:triose-phosphate isomerase family protein n=1 Tax=Glycomyces xiaoerkulensis TaxID=2038139 RepID=UPI000C265003|nr:triose-phosphate isomerase family protein [Glycomyces xiaoerkulensis]